MRKYTYAWVKDGYTVMERHESAAAPDGSTEALFTAVCHIPARWDIYTAKAQEGVDTAEEKARRIVAALALLEQERGGLSGRVPIGLGGCG